MLNMSLTPESKELIVWPATPADSAQREHLIAALRCASLRQALLKAEIDSIGCALRGDLITVTCALEWLHELGVQIIDAEARHDA